METNVNIIHIRHMLAGAILFACIAHASPPGDTSAALHLSTMTVPGTSPQDSAGIPLETFLRSALEHNPGLAAARSKERGATARIGSRKAWDAPSVGIDFFSIPVTTANPFNTMEKDYFVQQMIPIPGKIGSMTKASEAESGMANRRSAGAELQLFERVKSAYAMLWSAQRRLDVAGGIADILREIIRSSTVKYRGDQANQTDVLKARVELARLENERAAIGEEIGSAEGMLNALTGKPAASPIGKVAEIIPAGVGITLDEALSRAEETRPDIAEMKAGVEMKRSMADLARREWIPDIMLRGMYKQMAEGTDQWSAMIGISVPIAPWAGGKYSGESEEADADVKSTEESLAEMKLMAGADVRSAWARVHSQWETLRRYSETILPETEQGFHSAVGAYQMNTGNFLSLLESWRMLKMLRMEYIMAVGEYAVRVAKLEEAVGGNIQ
jgi:outer membrane protein, heavy metal efflux system